jgi:hypothetical protein
MTQPPDQPIQVDPTQVIRELETITGQLVHDLALTRAAVAAANIEIARLARVNAATSEDPADAAT